jgi:hypothetical protein
MGLLGAMDPVGTMGLGGAMGVVVGAPQSFPLC